MKIKLLVAVTACAALFAACGEDEEGANVTTYTISNPTYIVDGCNLGALTGEDGLLTDMKVMIDRIGDTEVKVKFDSDTNWAQGGVVQETFGAIDTAESKDIGLDETKPCLVTQTRTFGGTFGEDGEITNASYSLQLSNATGEHCTVENTDTVFVAGTCASSINWTLTAE